MQHTPPHNVPHSIVSFCSDMCRRRVLCSLYWLSLSNVTISPSVLDAPWHRCLFAEKCMFSPRHSQNFTITVNSGLFQIKLGAVFNKASFTPVTRADIEQLVPCFCDMHFGPKWLSQFGPWSLRSFLGGPKWPRTEVTEDRSDQGPKWPRTEVTKD